MRLPGGCGTREDASAQTGRFRSCAYARRQHPRRFVGAHARIGKRKRGVDMRLPEGMQVAMKDGAQMTVKEELGEGGQAFVYLVEDALGGRYALKWYKDAALDACPSLKDFYDNLADMAKREAPDDRFLWPLGVTRVLKNRHFGYVMELLEERYTELTEILNMKVQFGDFRILCRAASETASAFEALHKTGRSYQDINAGGIFVDMRTGDVKVCDCDNVAPDGESITGIKGFPGFMAPEVVLGYKRPWRGTDQHSLAVAFFWMAMCGHPLHGAYEQMFPTVSERSSAILYGSDALFIFDEHNDANRPVPGIHDNQIKLWGIYPEELRAAFRRAFSQEALRCDSNDSGRKVAGSCRVKDYEWAELFDRLASAVYECPRCPKHVFYDPSDPGRPCGWCGARTDPPFAMICGKRAVPLALGRTVMVADLGRDGSAPVATLVENPADRSVLGLRNETTQPWVYPDGSLAAEPGKSVVVSKGGIRRQAFEIIVTLANQGFITNVNVTVG